MADELLAAADKVNMSDESRRGMARLSLAWVAVFCQQTEQTELSG